MANAEIDRLQIQVDYEAGQSANGITQLTQALNGLQTIISPSASKLTTFSNGLKKMNAEMASLQTADLQSFNKNISTLSTSLKPLTELGTNRLGSFVKQLKQIPEVSKELDVATIDDFTKKIEKLTTAMIPLANQMAKVTAGFSSLPSKVSKASSNVNKYLASNNLSSLGTAGKLFNVGIFVHSAVQAGRALAPLIKESNAYVENLNLFTVAMGEASEQAKEWTETFSNALGLDVSQVQRYMGVFQMLGTGFGLSNDMASLMSENLTQLTYDISSFYNIPIEESATKLQSALAGELEPVRRLGYALDQATLKQIAYNNGIEKSFTAMTQAEKAQLRYIALLTQNEQVQGDMARTLITPANSLRILSQQFTLLARSVGNIFIPILMKILPVAIAVTKAIRMIADAIASLFGFEIPEIDYSGIQNLGTAVEDVGDSVSGTGKQISKQLAKFDELNNLTTNAGAGGGAGAGIDTSGFELDLPTYDALESLSKQMDDLTDKVLKFFGITKDAFGNLSWSFGDMDTKAKLLVGTVGLLVGAKILGKLVAIIGTITKGYSKLKKVTSAIFGTSLMKKYTNAITKTTTLADGTTKTTLAFGNLLKVSLKIGSAIGGVVLAYKGLQQMLSITREDTESAKDGFLNLNTAQEKAMVSLGEFTAGGALIGTAIAPGIGTAIGAIVGSLGSLVASMLNVKKVAQEEFNEELFGNIEISSEHLQALSQGITQSFSQQATALSEFISNINSASEQARASITDLDQLIYSYSVLGEEISGVTTQDLLGSVQKATQDAQTLITESSNGIIKTLTAQWAKSTELTQDEQKEIISILNDSKATKSAKVKEIENNITKILEKTTQERRSLTQQEIEDIQNYYEELAKLTSNELAETGNEILALTSMLSDENASFTKESLEQINKTLEETGEKGTQLIKDAYNNRLAIARQTAQETYDLAIANNKSELEARQEYNKVYQALYEDAGAQELKDREYLNQLLTDADDAYNKQLYSQRDKWNREYVFAESGYQREIAKAKLDAYDQFIKDELGYLEEYKTNATTGGTEAGKKISDAFYNGIYWTMPKIPSINVGTVGTDAGTKMGNQLFSGMQSALTYRKLNLSALTQFNNSQKTDYGSITFRTYATGGLPDVGEFFMARESGPELVGRIGNKNAVANNDQIVEGISAGVYNAMVSAGTNNNTDVTVVLSNKTIRNTFTNGVRSENNRYGRAVVEV